MEKPQRKPNRLKGYDYSTPGYYFITMCSHNHKDIFANYVGAIRESPLQSRSIISKVMGYIKMNSSKQIHNEICEGKIWQRSFHDHIIRDEKDYQKIWQYIDTNPTKWNEDCFYLK